MVALWQGEPCPGGSDGGGEAPAGNSCWPPVVIVALWQGELCPRGSDGGGEAQAGSSCWPPGVELYQGSCGRGGGAEAGAGAERP